MPATETWTTLRLLQTTAQFFEQRRCDAPRLAAERLLAHVLACKRVDLYLDGQRRLDERQLGPYRDLVRGYVAGAPLQYLVGEVEFMGLPLGIDRRALIPRPETEILVDAVQQRLAAPPLTPRRVLELGAGSGAIAVALAARLPHVEVWATEIDAAAARLASENAARLEVAQRVHVLVMQHFEALSPELHTAFDCVVSNPPYVRTDEMAALPTVVRDHEPLHALHGGVDGLDFHRYLCSEGRKFLAPGGTLAMEVGAEQGEAARRLLEGADFSSVVVLRDYAGLDRVVLGRR